MKCPSCLSLMECISAINPVPGQLNKNRMDLHCTSKQFPGRRGCGTLCHMGVITEDPKEWKCHEYGFAFRDKNKIYRLSGHDYLVDPFHQHRPNTAKTLLIENFDQIMIEVPYFILISTGDNMHEEAWKLFHRLRNLVIYS